MNMIPVTKPFLPPRSEYIKYVEGIWDRMWVTNNGPLVKELELRLKEALKVNHMLYVSNGTFALQLAIKALDLEGEIITTPFSYVATTSSIVWEGCVPVYVDIDPQTLNIDAYKIEEAITENTAAILATHCFGNPCDIERIQQIADKHKIKVIYDAAHCYGTDYRGESIFNYGDISITSFHATKVFHTIEGGAVFTKDPILLKKMALMRNFGHDGPERFQGVGINGKNSEFHAAMGLVNLKYMDEILKKRKDQSIHYLKALEELDVTFPKIVDTEEYNYSYFPVIFESEEICLNMKRELERKNIYTRRYFYPSLSNLSYVQGDTPISSSISSRILCLPLYFELATEQQDMIARILFRTQNYKV